MMINLFTLEKHVLGKTVLVKHMVASGIIEKK